MRVGAWVLIAVAWVAQSGTALAAAPGPSTEQRQLDTALTRLKAHPGQPGAVADALAVARTFGALPAQRIAVALAPIVARWRLDARARSTPTANLLRDLLRTAAQRADRRDLWTSAGAEPGAVRHFSWIGPFGAEHGSAYARDAEVEREAATLHGAVPQSRWPGRDGEVAWQVVPEGFVAAGERLPFEELVDRPDDAVLYVQTWIRPPREGAALLRLGVDGAARVWLGAARVLDVQAKPELYGIGPDVPALPEVAQTTVQLQAGWQRLLIKLAPDGGGLPLSIVLCGARGEPLEIDSSATFMPADAASVAQPVAPTPSEDSVAGLVWRENGRKARPSPLPALMALAWHGWPMPDALTERLLGALPEELPPTADLALGHALLAGEVGDRIDRLRQWLTVLPDSAALLVAQAAALDEMGKTAAAHRLWEDFAEQTGQHPEDHSVRACIVRVDLWTRLGADLAAQDLLAACGQRWPDSPELLRARVRAAMATDRLAEALRLGRILVQLEPGRLERHMDLLQALVTVGDQEGAEAEALEIGRRFGPRDRSAEVMAAFWLAEQQPDKARLALARLPKHLMRTSYLELSARIAARMGDRDGAVARLREAVALSPSRAELRTRLQLLRPDGDFFAAHRKDLVAVVKSELSLPRPHPEETRLRQTVLQVVGNGQQARYDAAIVYVGKGGEPKHEVEIEYAPTLSRAEVLQAVIVRADGRIERGVSQEVDQLGEDASGMYYDLERITLGFKGLKPGDSVVVEYVVRDLAPTPFGLVFGELLTLGEEHPVRETEIIVQVPERAPLYFEVADGQAQDPSRTSRVAGTAMTRHSLPKTGNNRDDAGPWDEWHLHLGPLPGVKQEANMPGATDVTPYLHLSSFPSWAHAARWYQDLMAEALPTPGADPAVRELALRLTAHAASTEDKVRAIYAFATQQVRYVGLEFGIHSLKPHAVRDVIQRQFGDCKDKAALVVALCAEVGIAAELALVRTVDQGRLHDQIASLGVFNHAIAYVPELGWWLDATAQHHGVRELPDGDTGGMALRIPTPHRASGTPHPGLVTLPEQPAADHEHQERIDIQLQPDGAASLQIALSMRGLPAAEVRTRLFTAQTRKERLEQDYAGRFPGLVVNDVEVTGADPIADRLEVRIQARVPQLARSQGGALACTPLRPPQPYTHALTPQPLRTWDLLLQHPFAEVTTIVVHPPPGRRFARLPAPIALPWQHGVFSLAVRTLEDGSAELETHFSAEARRVTPEQYASFRAWLAAIDAALRAEVLLGP